jgi:hypothetical protein
MRVVGKRVGELQHADLEALIANGVGESVTLEYKRELPGDTDKDKRDFLADVTAFANTDGGVLLYGVATGRDENNKDTGVPDHIPGLALNADAEKLRLGSVLRDAVEPGLVQGLEFAEIRRPGESVAVLALGIAPSFARPHRVTYKKGARFYRRDSAGNYEPDVTELRQMFLESDSWVRECEQFRTDRLQFQRSIPNLERLGGLTVHLLPLGRLRRTVKLRDRKDELMTAFQPLHPAGFAPRFNADGFVIWSGNRDGKPTRSYTQCFRFGGVEMFSSRFILDQDSRTGTAMVPMLYVDELTAILRDRVPRAVASMKLLLETELPLALLLSLRGLQGAIMATEARTRGLEPIDREDLILGAEVIESEADPLSVLNPMLDVIWQAGNFDGAPPAKS